MLLVIVVEGVSHDFKYDCDLQRDTFLKELGLNIIHIPDSDVKRDINAVINYLKEHEYFRDKWFNHPVKQACHPSKIGGE